MRPVYTSLEEMKTEPIVIGTPFGFMLAVLFLIHDD